MVLFNFNTRSKLVFKNTELLQKKKVWKRAKIKILAGQAKVVPPISSILGQFGINLLEFCENFNLKTKHLNPDLIFSVYIIIFSNKTFTLSSIKLMPLDSFGFSELVKIKDRNVFCILFYRLYCAALYSRNFMSNSKIQVVSKNNLVFLKQLFGYLNSFGNVVYLDSENETRKL